MLLDCGGNINYDYFTMADEQVSTTEARGEQATMERRAREGFRAVDGVLKHEFGKGKDPSTPEGEALKRYNELAKTKKGRKFEKFDDPKKNLMLTDVRSDGKPVRLAGFLGENDEGELECYFEDDNGSFVQGDQDVTIHNSDGSETTDRRLVKGISRDLVIQLYLQSDPDAYRQFFQGESAPLFEAFISNKPFGQEFDSVVKAIKEKTGLPIFDSEFIEPSTPEADNVPEYLHPANQAIGEQIKYFEYLLEKGELTAKQQEKVNVVLKQLITAKTAANGELFGAQYKATVLTNAEALLMDLPLGDEMAKSARRAINALHGRKEGEEKTAHDSAIGEERSDIEDALKNVEDMSDEERNKVMDLVRNAKSPADMVKVLAVLGADNINIPNLKEGLIGTGISDSEAQIKLDEIVKSANLSEAQKKDIAALALKYGGKGLLGVIIAILAAGGLAVAGAVGATIVGGSMLNSGGR